MDNNKRKIRVKKSKLYNSTIKRGTVTKSANLKEKLESRLRRKLKSLSHRKKISGRIITDSRPKTSKINVYTVTAIVAVAVCAVFFLTSYLVLNISVKEISVNDMGRIVYAKTTEKTVKDFLDKNNIEYTDMDTITPSIDESIHSGMEIIIKRDYSEN